MDVKSFASELLRALAAVEAIERVVRQVHPERRRRAHDTACRGGEGFASWQGESMKALGSNGWWRSCGLRVSI